MFIIFLTVNGGYLLLQKMTASNIYVYNFIIKLSKSMLKIKIPHPVNKMFEFLTFVICCPKNNLLQIKPLQIT